MHVTSNIDDSLNSVHSMREHVGYYVVKQPRFQHLLHAVFFSLLSVQCYMLYFSLGKMKCTYLWVKVLDSHI